jgi:hypothetical protein
LKVLYSVPEIDVKMRNLFIADLIGYKLQRDLEATQKLRKLSENKGWMMKVVDTARKSQSSGGMTLDMVMQGLQTALNIDIFSFKVNGVDLFKLLDEKVKSSTFEVEVFMNPLYFSSEIALKNAVMPGFRKPVLTEEYMQERMKKAGKAWLFQFEKNCKEYLNYDSINKTILEE